MRRLLFCALLVCAGCSSEVLTLSPQRGLDFRRDQRVPLDGRVGLTQFADLREFPFDAMQLDWADDWFARSEVAQLRDALAGTLRAGDAVAELVDLDEPPLLEPTPAELARFAETHPELDYVLTGRVEALNLTSLMVGTVDVTVGNVDYRNIAYYGRRLRIRVHLEVYSLRLHEIVWGDVLEGLGHNEVHEEQVQPALDLALERLCESLQASLATASLISGSDDAIDLDYPSQAQLIEAAVLSARLRQFGIAEDYEDVHAKGKAWAQEEARKDWERKVAGARLRLGIAQAVNALNLARARETGQDPSTVLLIDTSGYEAELRRLGAETGTSIVSFDPGELEEELIHKDPPQDVSEGQSVEVEGQRFTLYSSERVSYLSQLAPGQTVRLANVTERIMQAYLDAYGDRNDFRAKFLSKQERPVMFVVRDRETYKAWLARWSPAQVNSGAFYHVIPRGSPLIPALQATGTGGVGTPYVVIYWHGHADDYGNPVPGAATLWSSIPHELGHHVHRLLLNENDPDFQADGFTQYHEYPIDFSRNLRFGVWANPTTDEWLWYLDEKADPMPLDELVGADYGVISNNGQNSAGYASVWLYYQYLMRTRRRELIAFEQALAAEPRRPGKERLQAMFRQAFGLRSQADVRRLGEEARAWLRGRGMSDQDLEASRRAIAAVTSMTPQTYIVRRRKSAVQVQ